MIIKSILKRSMLVAFIASALISCDVRDKQKQEIGAVEEKPVAAATTTVQIIDSVFDFGQITEGENVEYSFRFKNTGADPLIVTNATASCGCTVPEKPEAPIKPGETGFIRVKFNSDKRPGQTSKSVHVTSNANPAFPELLIKGNVIAKTNN